MAAQRLTAEGSRRFVARHAEAQDSGFYRLAQGCLLSSIGIGTYLGSPSDEDDRRYRGCVIAAVRAGANVIDTAINYRHQRSERSIGAALKELFDSGDAARDEVLVCTKAGFLTPGALPAGYPESPDVAGRMHSMAPDFLEDQLARSLANLGLEAIDVYYLHNPETQLRFVSVEQFEERLLAAFACLERFCREGRIGAYGVATWDGLRLRQGAPGRLRLLRLAELAKQAAGGDCHFRFVQLPFNLAMPEAFTRVHEGDPPQGASLLETAARHGITVIASAPLAQARLAHGLPEAVRRAFPECRTDAQCALQFARSAPGMTTALAGMSSLVHVEENLGLARVPPAPLERWLALFEQQA
ncbi:MAG: aldo/keto reductase [Bryobacteraceae bacterium]|nr:aldo/keto reductase [Bryobacteraceae bacterium]